MRQQRTNGRLPRQRSTRHGGRSGGDGKVVEPIVVVSRKSEDEKFSPLRFSHPQEGLDSCGPIQVEASRTHSGA